MITDFKLSEHFGLFEATTTLNANLREKNREMALSESLPDVKGRRVLDCLRATCSMMEMLRAGIGNKPVLVHSMYRCPELNGSTPGSAKTSQHMRGEACDFSVSGATVTDAALEMFFEEVLSCLISKQFPFGQLIKEKATRDYGSDRWLHLSLGVPFRKAERCGEIMELENGAGKLIKQITFHE